MFSALQDRRSVGLSGPRGVVVHEWIEESGGSERVYEQLLHLRPNADQFCLWNSSKSPAFSNVQESWLARTPLRRNKAAAAVVMPLAWRHARKANYEWALISSHLFAHQARINRRGPIIKLVYVHTPARYIWTPDVDGRGRLRSARIAAPILKAYDRRKALEITSAVANSRFIQTRIRETWGIEAGIIYPPVRVEHIQRTEDWSHHVSEAEYRKLDQLPDVFILGASRFVPYKRLDLAILAGESVGLPVVIAGSGSDGVRLKALAASASVPVSFILDPSDEMLFTLYGRALVYVFPAIEDFGIMPVEAMACGTPVLVDRLGGAKESVSQPIAGRVIETWSRCSLRNAVHAASGLNRNQIAKHATSFSTKIFDKKLNDWLNAHGAQ